MLLMGFAVRLLQMARRVQSKGDNTCAWYSIVLGFFFFSFLFFKVHLEKEIVCWPFFIFAKGRL